MDLGTFLAGKHFVTLSISFVMGLLKLLISSWFDINLESGPFLLGFSDIMENRFLIYSLMII